MTTFVTSELHFNKETGLLTKGSWEGSFPHKVNVISSQTSRVVVFHFDQRSAEHNEYWDGEMMLYRTWDSDLAHKIKVTIMRGSI